MLDRNSKLSEFMIIRTIVTKFLRSLYVNGSAVEPHENHFCLEVPRFRNI